MEKDNYSTVKNFGNQWNIFNENEGYYASQEIFQDLLKPLLEIDFFLDKTVADIGSGTGRIVKILSKLKVKKIYAIEPSESFDILKNGNYDNNNIEFIKSRGQDFNLSEKIDIFLSIGVLHHIYDPEKVMQNCIKYIKKGGLIFVWLYAKEGNEIYLFFFKFIHLFTAKMDDKYLLKFVDFLHFFLKIYINLCRFIKLPMQKYMLNVIGKMNSKNQKLTIFDQLNPVYSKYYTKSEVYELLSKSGFTEIKIFKRHGYSYSAIGIKT